MNLEETIAFDLEERAKHEEYTGTEYVYTEYCVNNFLSGEFVLIPHDSFPSLEEAVLVLSSDVRVFIEKRGHVYALCDEHKQSHWCVVRSAMKRWKK